jgi:hypothetical protein
LVLSAIIYSMNEKAQKQLFAQENFQISAINKRENSNNYIYLIVLTFVTIGMMLISTLIFRNFISAITILLCTVVLMLYYIQKPKTILVQTNDEKLIVGNESIFWKSVKAWDIVEGSELTEVFIITSNVISPSITFYLLKSNFHNYNTFLDIMYDRALFQKDLAFTNNFQNILRIIGLK